MELHLERLHYGQPILKPVYDHAAGTLVRPDYVLARQFVIVEGLLGFLTPTLRQFFDVKVYLDPPEDLRWAWKIKRDTSKRGYRPEEVQAERQRREPDSQAFIRPQREHADIVVRFAPADGIATENVEARLDARLVLRPTINHPDLSYLLEKEGDATPGIRLELGRDQGRPADFLEIGGSVTAEHAAELEDAVWQHLPDLRPVGAEKFGAYQDRTEERYSQTLALTQLLITYHLLRKYGDVSQLPFAPAVAALSRLSAAQVPVTQAE
jgi:phosphoribulokinase